MKHSVSTRKKLTILKLEEPVFDVRHADCFKATIDSLISNQASKNIIIDCSQVKAIDSSGISSMLIAHKLANSFDGLTIFVALCQQIKELLKIANLDKQLFIFSSINEVMTLIEPSLKAKRASKTRRQQQNDDDNDGDDEVTEEIDILPDDAYNSESFDDMDDETTDESDECEEGDDETDDKPRKVTKTPKKRGRPKKNSQPVKAVRKKSEHLD